MSYRHKAPEGFQERLKKAVYDSGLSLNEIERRSGVAHSSLSAYMTRDYSPTVFSLARLCTVLKVSADYLLFGKEVEKCNT